MESPKHSLHLEKELTCSICTELLFQPLTLLDCIHTFCGACLKEWFTFQAATAQRSPNPPSPGSSIFTCPSCRATVRDTKHNATVVNLLDMFVAAHPEKGRSEDDKDEMRRKYTPGEQVLPKVQTRERTSEERRADDEDRRLMDQVREMSLREVGAANTGLTPPTSRPRTGSHSGDERPRSSRDRSSTNRSRRPRDDEGHRRRRSESRQRQVEHQSSLRSLIGVANMSERDLEQEIEAFARQIQEEGLLDGLDLDNIDLSRDDELSRRITEAYRRRQRERERTRSEGARRGAVSNQGTSTRSSDQRHAQDGSSRSGTRQRSQASSDAATRSGDERSRPPASMPGPMDGREGARKARRRTSSQGRSETIPPLAVAPSSTARRASRSQTDLTLRTNVADAMGHRPGVTGSRSVSESVLPPTEGASSEGPSLYPAPLFSPSNNASNNASNNLSFANRAPAQGSQGQAGTTPTPVMEPPPDVPPRSPARTYGPVDLASVWSAVSSPIGAPSGGPNNLKARPQLYPEPSITCSQCARPHIEYEVHYNCSVCASGQWNICLDCYRGRKGCKHWFGFGYGAWAKWEKRRKEDESLSPPHMLTASRYLAPPSIPGGADGRRTLTKDDPQLRMETGTFCSRCFAWTNHCYWRCDACNEGDWGFCNNCVNQGKSCSHLLLPLTHEASSSPTRTRNPRAPIRPPSSTIFTGPDASSIGPFKPLTFSTRCDVCQDPIAPTQIRHHCYSCTSSLVPNGTPGDYDICMACYKNLVNRGQISAENGHNGWRRCLNGHRMAIVGFTLGKIGQWRYIEREVVGGRALRSEAYEAKGYQGPTLMRWSWLQDGQRVERLVAKEVTHTAPTSDGTLTLTQAFPLDGGSGPKGIAKWAWYPAEGADDELLFPKGSEIREIEDVNGEWFHGTYMGSKGLFPANYVRLIEAAPTT